MLTLILLFLLIFTLNLIPAFAPPTWMVFSFVGFHFPSQNGADLAIAGRNSWVKMRGVMSTRSAKISRAERN
jgi:hypothetical protein